MLVQEWHLSLGLSTDWCWLIGLFVFFLLLQIQPLNPAAFRKELRFLWSLSLLWNLWLWNTQGFCPWVDSWVPVFLTKQVYLDWIEHQGPQDSVMLLLGAQSSKIVAHQIGSPENCHHYQPSWDSVSASHEYSRSMLPLFQVLLDSDNQQAGLYFGHLFSLACYRVFL